MNKVLLAASVLLFLIIALFALNSYIDKNGKLPSPETPAPKGTTVESAFTPGGPCDVKDLSATFSFNSGAGTTHGDFFIKNISKKTCSIFANKFISVNFSKEITNVKIDNVTRATATFFDLEPGTKIKGGVSFPLGAQCNGPTLSAPVTYTYQISASSSVTFAPNINSSKAQIRYCSSPTEITNVEVLGMGGIPSQ